jgi:spermidine/putrescine transport system substrate-binding protein
VDVAHPCNARLLRWRDTGLFQPIDTARLSDCPDLIPGIADRVGEDAGEGRMWMAPFDRGQTPVTYRTDLFGREGEESWHMLWDPRRAGRDRAPRGATPGARARSGRGPVSAGPRPTRLSSASRR